MKLNPHRPPNLLLDLQALSLAWFIDFLFVLLMAVGGASTAERKDFLDHCVR